VARELADVLHYFLDDDGARSPVVRCLALVAEPDELLGVALLWNLAQELARAGSAVAWVTAVSDEELLPSFASPGITRLLAPAHDLTGLARGVREAGAKLLGRRAPGVVLTRVPPSWLEPCAAAGELLGRSLLLCGPDAELRAEALARGQRIARACPGARVGVTLHGVRSVREAEAAFEALASVASPPGGFWSYGLLLDDSLLYDALLARRPVVHHRPESRAARAVRDVARLLQEDWQRDGV